MGKLVGKYTQVPMDPREKVLLKKVVLGGKHTHTHLFTARSKDFPKFVVSCSCYKFLGYISYIPQ